MVKKFKEGEIVQSKLNPTQNLVARRYVERIYYCKVQADPKLNALAFFERELIPHN